MEGRRFTDGIQQAIEAKEGMQVSAETEVIGKIYIFITITIPVYGSLCVLIVLRAYIHTYIHTYIHLFIHIHIHIYTYIYTHLFTCSFLCV